MSNRTFSWWRSLEKNAINSLINSIKSQELQTVGPSAGVRNAYDVGGGKKSCKSSNPVNPDSDKRGGL
jgi:hypothetical protein